MLTPACGNQKQGVGMTEHGSLECFSFDVTASQHGDGHVITLTGYGYNFKEWQLKGVQKMIKNP